jgi:hypothetical protein
LGGGLVESGGGGDDEGVNGGGRTRTRGERKGIEKSDGD